MSSKVSENGEASFPGGSKSRVNRAGDAVRRGCSTAEDLCIIDEWRAAHRAVLNTFQTILRGRAKGADITVAQRHKRRRTIFDKLQREPKMDLARMDDVAGCRLIFRNVGRLYAFREHFQEARFKHRRRNANDKYDYIKHPKSSGYRGVHDVYEYDVSTRRGKPTSGLYVEIQYRTLVQHAWATAVEVIGLITESQPKFQRGDGRVGRAMALAGEILARAEEKRKGPFPEVPDAAVVNEFLLLDADLGLMKMLRGLNAADKAVSRNRNTILIFSEPADLEVRTYRGNAEALRELFELEKRYPEGDIVLVRADTSEQVRLAYRNYFTDARDFIKMVARGCKKLAS